MVRAHAIVEVRTTASGAPWRMRWRGRWHVVHTVVAHWVEMPPWWSAPVFGVQQQHMWRVVLSAESARVERARVEKEWVEKNLEKNHEQNLIAVDLMVRDAVWRVVAIVD